MDELETKMVEIATKILDSYKVPRYHYSIFKEKDDTHSLQKEGDYYKLYYVERGNKRLIIESKNIKFIFSYLIMNCVPLQYKFEARKKFINKIKEEN